MARHSSIWQRKRDGWWMTTINGTQLKLALDKKEALKAFHELMASSPDAPADTTRLTFRRLADQFLAHCNRTVAESTFQLRRHYLQSFCDHIKKLAVSNLRVQHVTTWESENPAWSQSTIATTRGILTVCLNWAVEQGIIHNQPLSRLKTVAYTRRERTLSPSEKRRIKEVLSPALGDFLLAVELTGARPFSEIGVLTATMIDWEAGLIEFGKHKNSKKGKKRTIYLTPPLTALLRQKACDHPNGVLFRTMHGNQWTKSAVTRQIRKVEADTGIPRFSLYALRHTLITDALEKGLSAEVVAELVGNSPNTIHKYYSKLSERREMLKAAAAKIVN
jgi:integrase